MIERLLRETSVATFVQQFYLRFPFACVGGAAPFVNLGSWDTARAILAQPDVDVMVVRQAELLKSPANPCYEEARALHASGCTLVIRNSQKHYGPLEQLSASFRQDFHAPVDVHIYYTPAGHSGFGWHYDAEDVFILQTAGSKEYSLRKNTVHPWPLVETIPRDMQFEREIMPLMRCTLAVGDWLYIPAGYWHRAQAADSQQESISLAIGVMSTAAIEVLDFLRPRLLSSLLWRQRLPSSGQIATHGTADLFEQYRSIFNQLGEDLARTIGDPQFVREFVARGTSHAPITPQSRSTNRAEQCNGTIHNGQISEDSPQSSIAPSQKPIAEV